MKNGNRSRLAGFTLIELLIVIVILGLLASLVAPNFFSKLASSERAVAKAQMSALGVALDAYRLDVGRYPPSLQELRESNARRWDGPYLPKDIPMDPWGYEYQYRVPGENGQPYYLFSFGADGQLGGEDSDADIVYE